MTAAASLSPEGHPARCARHEGAPALAVCARCGRFCCAACVDASIRDRRICADCVAAVPAFPWHRHRSVHTALSSWWMLLVHPLRAFDAIRSRSKGLDGLALGVAFVAASFGVTLGGIAVQRLAVRAGVKAQAWDWPTQYGLIALIHAGFLGIWLIVLPVVEGALLALLGARSGLRARFTASAYALAPVVLVFHPEAKLLIPAIASVYKALGYRRMEGIGWPEAIMTVAATTLFAALVTWRLLG
ncbi:MAG TPA: hypothetical protein VFA20_09635 [Myxococcaceae bacterium]|nr:hypothetical protein [Myxococcaceae bacterium]